MMRSGATKDMLYDATAPVVDDAQGRAPKATGAGARGIHQELVLTADEWESLVSWDQDQFYMYWHEKGSRYLPARPFLVPALRAALT